MNVAQSLRSMSAYPIPAVTLQSIAAGEGLDADELLTSGLLRSREYRRAQAGVYLFLSEAPNVSQNGISYSFSDDDRRRFRTRAESILDELGDKANSGVSYGYQGEEL